MKNSLLMINVILSKLKVEFMLYMYYSFLVKDAES